MPMPVETRDLAIHRGRNIISQKMYAADAMRDGPHVLLVLSTEDFYSRAAGRGTPLPETTLEFPMDPKAAKILADRILALVQTMDWPQQ